MSLVASNVWRAQEWRLSLARDKSYSLAVRLLRQNTPLKTIGDLLGHRSPHSTEAYLRLNVEDLREAALDLPSETGVPA